MHRARENLVLPGGIQKFQFVTIGIDDLTYRVRSCPFLHTSLGWSRPPEVPH
jgi:hypothetical protein